MNDKKSKEVIFQMNLGEFGIPQLTIWVNQPRVRYVENFKRWTIDADGNKLVGSERLKAVRKAKSVLRKDLKCQPVTVGQLVKKYPYHFPDRGRSGMVKLGIKSVKKLKSKLIELGLTPDDWPALVPYREFLVHLSKSAIPQIPIGKIIADLDLAEHYFGCKKEDVAFKTVRDFIKLSPSDISDWHSRQAVFFKRHKRRFITIRQLLINKGFGLEDGNFFSWNPEFDSMDKAVEILRKYELSRSDLERFARIAVSERWVV
jgi:hypothetical protein